MENIQSFDQFAIITKIQEILERVLPKGFNIIVSPYKGFEGTPYVKIAFSPSTVLVNNVRGQYAQVVSLSLNLKTMELTPQVFGGNGGQSIYRKPNMEDPKEKYLAMKSVKIPFRKPKAEEKFVLNAIENFAKNYLLALKENKDVLMYKDIVDYDSFL